ncbi:MAG: hypothetical protein CR986_07925 [Ignavibacteriae bacterium]|nr:MAG: hypothetical protein CR986_07925 [Ignavibacteriota bacterium]
MSTLLLFYNEVLSEKIKTSLKETIIILLLLLVYNFSFYYSSFLNEVSIEILNYIGAIYICYVWIKTIKGSGIDHLRFWILFEFMKRTYLKYFHKDNISYQNKLLNEQELNKLLFVVVKIFYIPVMLNFTINNFNHVDNILFRIQFYRFSDFTIAHWYKLFIPFIFFIDTSYFLFGYLFESKKLNNKVKSVDKSGISWLVTLACYPPLNLVTAKIFPWYANEENLMVSSPVNEALLLVIILLFGVYLSATLSLGPKCSNLTNRGIVTNGIYKYIRHPAYTSKVFAWWLMTLPIMDFGVFISMFMWTFIYLFRALKEEDHLLNDPDYQTYYKNTPYRFIPKIF